MFSTEGGSAAKMLAIICHRFKLSCYMFYIWFSLLYNNNHILVTIHVFFSWVVCRKYLNHNFVTVICFVFFFPYEELAWTCHFYSQTMRFYNFLLQSSFSSFSLRLDKMSSGRRLGSIGCPNEDFLSVFFSSKIGYDVSVGLRQNGAHRKHGVLT